MHHLKKYTIYRHTSTLTDPYKHTCPTHTHSHTDARTSFTYTYKPPALNRSYLDCIWLHSSCILHTDMYVYTHLFPHITTYIYNYKFVVHMYICIPSTCWFMN
eukprot:GHVQ01017170.1.p1 GENE.GHVQ01017170.1~~GHVQ01017170.1.p1  ORF type:complete len:103 (-),score=4.87 GHVQ01017170.1:417-725(-)